MTKDLAQVLADWRGDAAVLRTRGHEHDAELIEQLCRDVAAATEDFLVFLSEPDARLFSGLTEETLRKRFPGWHEQGHARLNAKGKREYRQLVLPRRPDVAAARAAGRRGSQEDAA